MENTIGDVCVNPPASDNLSYIGAGRKAQKKARLAAQEPSRNDHKSLITIQDASIEIARDLLHANHQLKKKLAASKRTEKRLRAAVRIARAGYESNRFFLTNVNHELRTHLNTIIGFSDIIQNELHGPVGNSNYTGYAKDINQSGVQLLRLISDVLDISRMETGRFNITEEIIDISECMNGCVHRVAQQAENRRVNILRDIPVDLPQMRGDPVRIRQIFTSLLSNAVKLIPADGNVRVSAAKAVKGGIQININFPDAVLAPGDLKKMFGPSVRAAKATPPTYDAAGIELLMARLLTQWHDGALHIDRKSADGERITVIFPPSRIADEQSAIGRVGD